jgi:hypothetical protein
MTDNSTDNSMDPEAIERDVRRTQDEIGDTVEQLQEKMNPREITRSVIGDDGNEMIREVLDVVKRNPIPAAMVAVGAIWLFATSTRAQRLITDRLGSKSSNEPELRPRSAEPAPIGPPPTVGEGYDRRVETASL